MQRKPWELCFTAKPEEVAYLRRVVGLHLGSWGLLEVVDAAQLCVSELVSNVITHVGHGTPATLAVSMSGPYLRVEVHDPDTRALPTLLDAASDAEGGRGMALVDAIADRWGVLLRPGRKVTWCELATGLASANGHVGGAGVTRAEALIGLYGTSQQLCERSSSALGISMAEEVVVNVITDFLHWLSAHGCDADEVLDRAQTHFEAQIEGSGGMGRRGL
ncbi:ATP-binding protein [Streptomyces regalis]|uniref:Regulator n=1 Tax=Streptomyces regalis TaxID=68262 RepID=A0A0X3V0L0_9ACTN|nr:ATP-binding protein [Streptomyces regalis]KUL38299.1 regulator [Streptomyces regalis]